MEGQRAVPPRVLETLDALAATTALGGFYLAGGTSLALRFNHRVSVDLDFFHPVGFRAEEVLQGLSPLHQQVRVEYQDPGTLRLRLGDDDLKVEFFRYVYPLVRPLTSRGKVLMADPLDVGVMKLSAIASRGNRKDFIDLYWIDRAAVSLSDIWRAVPVKFADHLPDPYHIARSLGYLRDADREPDVPTLSGPPWSDIRAWCAEQADALLRQIEAGHPPW